MRKFLLLMVMAMLLVACESTDPQAKLDKTSPFLGGIEGVSAVFSNLRSEVVDGGNDAFDIIVMLENKGEFTVPKNDMRVRVSGINPQEFSKREEDLVASPEDDIIALKKDATGNVVKGTPVTVEFTGINYLGHVVGANQQFPLLLDACYSYGTSAVTYMCMLTDILVPKPGRVCEVNEAKPVYNSGAPIVVENVKETARGKDKIGFNFDIRHVGTGVAYSKASRCVNERFKNKVQVRVDSRLDGLTCTGLPGKDGTAATGEVTLFDNVKTISCAQVMTRKADFEQDVRITLGYDYSVQQKTEFSVKSSGEQ